MMTTAVTGCDRLFQTIIQKAAIGKLRQGVIERELADFVNTWIALKKEDQTIGALYEYWILGRSAVEREPRWSVIRNVLHLVS